jgi:hypothetical protein
MVDAIAKLRATAPNGRDYYPQGPQALGPRKPTTNSAWPTSRPWRTDLEQILTALDDR